MEPEGAPALRRPLIDDLCNTSQTVVRARTIENLTYMAIEIGFVPEDLTVDGRAHAAHVGDAIGPDSSGAHRSAIRGEHKTCRLWVNLIRQPEGE